MSALDIRINVNCCYLPEQSDPQRNYFVFSYRINISNNGTQAAQLISRHWIITDAHGNVQEVKGEGVVGQQPYLKPGENFEYTSVAVLNTPVGSMHGSYQMISDDGTAFAVPIPAFSLATPTMIH